MRAAADEPGTAPRVVTERLALTPLVGVDAAHLFAYRSLAEVSRYQSWEPACLADAEAFVEALAGAEFDTPGTWFQLGVRLRETDRLVGDLGVHFLDDGRQVEIGFTLAPDFQAMGLGTEAVEALLALLFGRLRKHRVFASVDPRNAPSVLLLERVGMRREAHHVESLLFKGEWADDLIYAMLAAEWADRAAGAAS